MTASWQSFTPTADTYREIAAGLRRVQRALKDFPGVDPCEEPHVMAAVYRLLTNPDESKRSEGGILALAWNSLTRSKADGSFTQKFEDEELSRTVAFLRVATKQLVRMRQQPQLIADKAAMSQQRIETVAKFLSEVDRWAGHFEKLAEQSPEECEPAAPAIASAVNVGVGTADAPAAGDVTDIDELLRRLNPWCSTWSWREAFKQWDEYREASKWAGQWAAMHRTNPNSDGRRFAEIERQNANIMLRAAQGTSQDYVMIVRGVMKLAPELAGMFPVVDFHESDQNRDAKSLAAETRKVAGFLMSKMEGGTVAAKHDGPSLFGGTFDKERYEIEQQTLAKLEWQRQMRRAFDDNRKDPTQNSSITLPTEAEDNDDPSELGYDEDFFGAGNVPRSEMLVDRSKYKAYLHKKARGDAAADSDFDRVPEAWGILDWRSRWIPVHHSVESVEQWCDWQAEVIRTHLKLENWPAKVLKAAISATLHDLRTIGEWYRDNANASPPRIPDQCDAPAMLHWLTRFAEFVGTNATGGTAIVRRAMEAESNLESSQREDVAPAAVDVQVLPTGGTLAMDPSVKAVLRQAERNQQFRKWYGAEQERKQPITDLWETVYAPCPHGDAEAMDKWYRDWSKRLEELGKAIVKAGYAEPAKTLFADNPTDQLASVVLKYALTDDAEALEKQLRELPCKEDSLSPKWWLPFNSNKLLLQVFFRPSPVTVADVVETLREPGEHDWGRSTDAFFRLLAWISERQLAIPNGYVSELSTLSLTELAETIATFDNTTKKNVLRRPFDEFVHDVTARPTEAGCPTCGKQAPIDMFGSLWCPDCRNMSGTLGELFTDLRLAKMNAGRRLAECNAPEIAHFRHFVRERFGGFDEAALNCLGDWLRAEHGMTSEQVLVCRLERINGLLKGGSNLPGTIEFTDRDRSAQENSRVSGKISEIADKSDLPWFTLDVFHQRAVDQNSNNSVFTEARQILEARLRRLAASAGLVQADADNEAVGNSIRDWLIHDCSMTAGQARNMSVSAIVNLLGNPPTRTPPSVKVETVAAGTDQSSDESAAEFAFYLDGGVHVVAGFGQRGSFPANLKGFAQIHQLIRSPNVPVPMVELFGGVTDPRIAADAHSRQPISDNQALRELWNRSEALKGELERAITDNDTVEASHCREEIDAIEGQLKQATGIGGKARDLNNPADKLRGTIHGTIRRAIKKLREAQPVMNELADHFEGSISSEGAAYVYRPANTVPAWVLDPPPKM